MTQTDLNTDNSSPSAEVLVLGEYSHISLFASGDDYDALFEPVDDVLFFAGEATSSEYPGTAHGAYLTGVAAVGEM